MKAHVGSVGMVKRQNKPTSNQPVAQVEHEKRWYVKGVRCVVVNPSTHREGTVCMGVVCTVW